MSAKARVAYVAEPPAASLARPPVVVDCSALGALLFEESLHDTASQLIAGRTLHAPWLLDHEIASVAERKRRAGVADIVVEAALKLYESHDITRHRVLPSSALPLAKAYALSASDAAYLALASELRIPLVTFDEKLGKAAMRHLGSLT